MKKLLIIGGLVSLLYLSACSQSTKPNMFAVTSSDNSNTTSTMVSSETKIMIDDPDIRNLKWGMSVDEVIQYEEETNYERSENSGSTYKQTLLTYNDVLFDGYETKMVLCITAGTGLDGVNYYIAGDKYKEIYDKLHEKYGSPTNEYNDYIMNAFGDVKDDNMSIMLMKIEETDITTQYSFFPLSPDYSNAVPEVTINETTQNITNETTMGEKNALKTALRYLDYTAFSYKGLIEPLEFEGYTHSEAVYGADNCGSDWNEQAAKCAKKYLDFSSFSRTGLIEQLEFEGFTHSQAVYGVEANGY